MLAPELCFCRNAKYLSLLQSIYNICKHQLQQIFIKSVILKILFMIITGCCVQLSDCMELKSVALFTDTIYSATYVGAVVL